MKKSFNEEYKTPTIRFISLQTLGLIASSTLTGGGNFGGADEEDYGDF